MQPPPVAVRHRLRLPLGLACTVNRVQESEEPICSARGCARTATVALRWNNPKIHTPDRRKTWLACDEHRQSLTDFLAARGFMRETEHL